MKRFFSILVAILMVMALIPMSVFAQDTKAPAAVRGSHFLLRKPKKQNVYWVKSVELECRMGYNTIRKIIC